MTLKKTLAAILATTIAISAMSISAFATTVADKDEAKTAGGTINTPTGVATGTISVMVPTARTIYIDTFAIKDTSATSQIYTSNMSIVNSSTQAVKVSIKGSVATTKTLAATKADVTNQEVSGNKAWVAMVGAKTVTVASAKVTAATYDKLDQLNEFSAKVQALSGTAAGLSYALPPKAGSAATVDNAAAVRLFGVLDAYTDWAQADLTFTMTYEIAGLAGAVYNAYTNGGTNKGVDSLIKLDKSTMTTTGFDAVSISKDDLGTGITDIQLKGAINATLTAAALATATYTVNGESKATAAIGTITTAATADPAECGVLTISAANLTAMGITDVGTYVVKFGPTGKVISGIIVVTAGA